MDSPRESQGTSILTSLFSHQLQASIVYKYSFLSRSLEAWNKLNNDVIEATTTERFSKRAVSEGICMSLVALSVYSVFLGLLGQCISVTYPRRTVGKLDRTTCPETHRPRAIMRSRD